MCLFYSYILLARGNGIASQPLEILALAKGRQIFKLFATRVSEDERFCARISVVRETTENSLYLTRYRF